MLGLQARKHTSKTLPYIQQVIDEILAAGHEIMLFPSLEENRDKLRLPTTKTIPYSDKVLRKCEAIFCVGGDGTLLEALTYIRGTNIPLLGINTGRLGFLASIAKEQIKSAFELFSKGRFTCEKRILIGLKDEENIFNGLNFALNEFVVLRRDTSSMIGISCYVDDYFVGKFWADGLMVATPTGSTAYSLSCGGPVSTPSCQHLILTPINPHNFSARSLIVPDSSRLTFKVESAARHILVSLDSRAVPALSNSHFSVYKENFSACLIQLEGSHFFNTLREKMSWGVDLRK